MRIKLGDLRMRLDEAWPSDTGAGDDLSDMITFAEAWVRLGAMVQEQVKEVLDRGQDAQVNPNAIEEALRIFQGVHDGLETTLQEWYDEYTGEGSYEGVDDFPGPFDPRD